jgi:putative hydroxymethylpyrimidine transporter CytX
MTVLHDVEAAHRGIAAVPDDRRRLSGLDCAVLWGDLGIGLLVIVAGALLVPALSLPRALLAIVVGSLLGCLLLALGALAGAREGVATMVLLRPVLGITGSWAPSALNGLQLLGWTAFELWAMAKVASTVSSRLFGVAAFGWWLAAATLVVTALALWGPVGVVRGWMLRFSAWVTVGIGLVVTVALLARGVGPAWSRPATGGLSFASAVDLVVAMPISWLPLVADYNRFARDRGQSFAGTFVGYAGGNAWFYALGALLVLAGGVADSSPEGLAAGILGLSAGTVVGAILLASLLAGETDEAFADIYPVAVSAQNVFPGLPQRMVVVVVGEVAAAIAAVVTATDYEAFLFLLGSVFVPLFAVVLAAAATGALRRDVDHEPAFRPAMAATWLVGFAVYHWMVPAYAFLPGWWLDVLAELPGAGEHTSLGASLPSFAVTFVLAAVVSSLGWRRSVPAAGT